LAVTGPKTEDQFLTEIKRVLEVWYCCKSNGDKINSDKNGARE